MAAAIGMILGAGVGAAAGEIRQKRQDQHKHDDALFDFYSKNPQLVADSPDAQKFITKYGGSEASQAFIGMAQHTKAASEQFGKNVMGAGGGAPTAGGPPAASGQPQPQMTEPKHFYDLADKGEQFLSSPDAQYLTDTQRKQGEEHIKYLRERGKQLEEEAQRAKYESPEAKATAAAAEERARLAPDIVRTEAGAEATKGAARAGAEARARLAPDITAREVSLAGRKSAAEATARSVVEASHGKPWTPANALSARTAAENQAQKELAPGGLFGKIRTPEGSKVKARAAEILKAEGLDENGQMVVGAHEVTATGPNGKKMVYRSGEWVPL